MALTHLRTLLTLALTTGADIERKIGEIEALKPATAADSADQGIENGEIAQIRDAKVQSAYAEIDTMISHLRELRAASWADDSAVQPPQAPPAPPVVATPPAPPAPPPAPPADPPAAPSPVIDNPIT